MFSGDNDENGVTVHLHRCYRRMFSYYRPTLLVVHIFASIFCFHTCSPEKMLHPTFGRTMYTDHNYATSLRASLVQLVALSKGRWKWCGDLSLQFLPLGLAAEVITELSERTWSSALSLRIDATLNIYCQGAGSTNTSV